VSGLIQENLIARSTVKPDRNLVAHRPGRQENSSLFVQEIGHHILKKIYRWILTLLLISDLSVAHEAPHFRSWLCHGIAE
jgi:hypothetical protein